MKAALLIVLSLSALAMAGPAFNKNNQIDTTNKPQWQQKQQHHQQQYLSNNKQQGFMTDVKPTEAMETLKQWCYTSQMSQQELTGSFKKLVSLIKASPEDKITEAAVMEERICQQTSSKRATTVQQKGVNEETDVQTDSMVDTAAHELVKDVYMDALIACDSRHCTKQLIRIIDSQQVDTIRASYYMTRMAVTEKSSIKDDAEVRELSESLIQGQDKSDSELIERQKLFATTALLGKQLEGGKQLIESEPKKAELVQIAKQVAKTIVSRYVETVSKQEVEQYTKEQEKCSEQLVNKIAKRSAALKALCNIPAWIVKDIDEVEQILVEITINKSELVTVRQSAIECLQQNEQVYAKVLKQIVFDTEEPIEVRVAAYRAIMTVPFSCVDKSEQEKETLAAEIVAKFVEYCQQQRNQQEDKQFVLYVISHLENLRTCQQPELEAINQVITKNKQHAMQVQVLCQKFKRELSEVTKYSRNYKLEQHYEQLKSGLVLEGDIIHENKNKQQQQQQQWQILPKVVRLNMSMPVMGETVNVVEITLRQNQMDQQLLKTFDLIKGAKFNSETVNKVVESFKSSVEQQQQYNTNQQHQQQQQTPEADLTIKVEGCTIIYMSADDFKFVGQQQQQQQQQGKRNIRSIESVLEQLLEKLTREPVNFNRGINFAISKRLGQLVDIEANLVAGLRFETRATGQSARNFEIVGRVEPRLAFESIVGPAKMQAKKLLQRASSKSALGFRYAYKNNELVDFQIDLPMNTMELFTYESQMVERSEQLPYSYNYLPSSIYGQQDIYTQDEEDFDQIYNTNTNTDDNEQQQFAASGKIAKIAGIRKMKRSIFSNDDDNKRGIVSKLMGGKSFGKRHFAYELDTPVEVARATGMHGKLRLYASPKDMSYLVQALLVKHDTSMRGYRVQVQKSTKRQGSETEQYLVSVSTPGSRLDRTMQIRLVKQQTPQRTLVKSEIRSPFVVASSQLELVHDQREYAAKMELASGNKRWRHAFQCGVQRNGQSQSGRIAQTYRPYLTIDSTSLRRPIQMQGVVSYQQSPKSVISYEFKQPASQNFVRGKIIVDLKQQQQQQQQRGQQGYMRRSMQSPWEIVFNQPMTLTNEFLSQIEEYAVKVNHMIDWDASQRELASDLFYSYKQIRGQQQEQQLVGKLRASYDKMEMQMERRCQQEPEKEFKLNVEARCLSNVRVEYRYQDRRSTSVVNNGGQYKHIVAYKHKLDQLEQSKNWKKLALSYQVELMSSEHKFNEKYTGLVKYNVEPREPQKYVRAEMQGRNQVASLKVDYVDLEQHQIELVFQGQQWQHRTTCSADQRQMNLKSITERRQQVVGKLVVDVQKQTGDVQVIVELPTEKVQIAADLKLQAGKHSSVAMQSPRFVTKMEFQLMEPSSRPRYTSMYPVFGGIRFMSNLKDLKRQQLYWIDSQIVTDSKVSPKSYLRVSSPEYRADVEFDQRQQTAKWGVYARHPRHSHQQFNSNKLYTTDESIIEEPFELSMRGQKELSSLLDQDKIWMVRSFVSKLSPRSLIDVEHLKREARRVMFEFASKKQSQRHTIEYQPEEEQFKFHFERQPTIANEKQQQMYKPIRFYGDLRLNEKPSSMHMDSDLVDFDFESKPFDGEESYAKLSALSRSRRSAPFKKHESEIRYNKQHGYKAWMKHLDQEDRRHLLELEADKQPKRWAKLAYESDKHGKVKYEHKYRHPSVLSKRSASADNDATAYYTNQFTFDYEPQVTGWNQRTNLQWEEPAEWSERVRRDVSRQYYDNYNSLSFLGKLAGQGQSVSNYLKHVRQARLNSQLGNKLNQEQLYKFNLDYQPEEQFGRFKFEMPGQMEHESRFDYQPSERFYKLQSKLFDGRKQQPVYELMASTKPWSRSQEQEMFTQEGVSQLFKQPMKLDYSDKFGRALSFDYDQLPSSQQKYQQLRQKRANFFLKDQSNNFEHQSTFDFVPESLFQSNKYATYKQQQQQQQPEITMKTHTKYGPVVVRADSDDKTLQLELESPVFSAKLTGETSVDGRSQLVKLVANNKHQNVKLAKIVRQTPFVCELELIEKLAQMVDERRVEHESELLVNIVDAILKVRSQTKVDGHQLVTVDSELNKQLNKLIVKIDGQRLKGQLVVDLMSKASELVLSVDNKQTLVHESRIGRVSNNFYSLQSFTSYKGKPVFEVQGKISAMLIDEPEHLFSRNSQSMSRGEEHISVFEAKIFGMEPKTIKAQLDCYAMKLNLSILDEKTGKVQTSMIQYDDVARTLAVDAKLESPIGGQIYYATSTISIPGIFGHQKHHTGKSYASYLQFWSTNPKYSQFDVQHIPGDRFYFKTPVTGPKMVRLAH